MSSLPEIGVVLPTDENLREIFKSFFQLRLWNLSNDGRKGYVLFTENFMAEYLHVNPKKCGTYTREITERCKSTTGEDYIFTAQLRDVIGKEPKELFLAEVLPSYKQIFAACVYEGNVVSVNTTLFSKLPEEDKKFIEKIPGFDTADRTSLPGISDVEIDEMIKEVRDRCARSMEVVNHMITE